MAQQGIQLDQERLCCSICLDLLKDPVTIPCGHNYCMKCIKSHRDEEDQKKIYSCPQCRQTFGPRPALVKNTMLADLVEELKKAGLHSAPADHCYAGPEDVACDFCTGRKLKALKSCLQCVVSYCEQHLQPHYEVVQFKNHKLVDPSKTLQESICTRHNEVMKIFCRTDQQCICYLCSIDEHKFHDTVSAVAEMTERQKELGTSRQKIQQRIQNREKDVKVLQQEVEAINCSADKAVRDSDEIFTDLIHLIEKRSSDVKQQIRSQQKSEASRVKELQKKLEEEISELRRKDVELEQLSHTEDHTQFLQNYPSLSCLSDSTDSSRINICPLQYSKDVMAAVSEVRDKLQDILSEVSTRISLAGTEDVLLPQAELETRTDFLKYSCQITLDPKTTSTKLLFSEGNRKATVARASPFTRLSMSVQLHSSPPGSHSSINSLQVLSRETLTGRCYWEVEWIGFTVSVAVTYTHMRRPVYESGFGNNDESWAVYCSSDGYEFRHNNIKTSISGPLSSTVGVYLDHSAGILSFYSVSGNMTLLHRVQTTFTQPLYAGLWVNYGSTAGLK
ncbi:tripartite motif-containing protein 16-like [Anoplopoma fimbria]|uniref:tripartite motif-containing protein 16-like n=1 Tax=Anoplopoma fimbria TaxID=229290 RepID=UPI0023EC99D7|nr:tripartite motif-containing protein 16-like [Anoplopoma fimbria]